MEKETNVVTDKTAASPKKKVDAAAPAKAKKAATAETVGVAKSKERTKPKKEKKLKVIRDSFTLPADDYGRLSELKQVCLKDGLHVKKSELVRAGLRLLSGLDRTELLAAMEALDKIKTGRPKSN